MKRRGITLVEVILVLLLIATAIAVLMPAQRRLQGTSTRTQTNNNLKQCALAVHNFHDTYRKLPDAFNDGGLYHKNPQSLWIHLLPFVEADNVYKSGITTAVVPAFNASSDPFNDDPAGKLNFAANLRVFAHQAIGKAAANEVGVAVPVPPSGTIASSNLTLPRIVDGTSNVLMMATRYAMCSGKATIYAAGPADFGGYFGAGTHSKPASSTKDDDVMFQIAPKNDRRSRTDCNPLPGVFGHSFGTGGMSTVLADATVKHIMPTMSTTTFTRALCPGDQQELGRDWVED